MRDRRPANRPLRAAVFGGVFAASFAALTVALVLVAPRPFAVDADAAAWISSLRDPAVTRVALVVTDLGSPVTLVVVVLAAVGWLWFRGAGVVALLVTVGTAAATAGLVTIVKVLVARERPPIQGLVGSPALDYAFPSGHTTDSAVVYLLVAVQLGRGCRPWLRRAAIAAAAVLAVLIAGTRLYLGYHWLTDVVGGWLLAAALLSLAALVSARLAGSADAARLDHVLRPDDTARTRIARQEGPAAAATAAHSLRDAP